MPLFNFPSSIPPMQVELPRTADQRAAAQLEAVNRRAALQAFLLKFGLDDRNSIHFRKLPNLTPCTEDDFWGYRTSYGFQCEVWLGQQDIGGISRWGHIMLYLIDHGRRQDGGFAVVHRYSYPDKLPVEYYEWGVCQHTFQEKNIGNCLHRYTCSKCGKTYDVDSSD